MLWQKAQAVFYLYFDAACSWAPQSTVPSVLEIPSKMKVTQSILYLNQQGSVGAQIAFTLFNGVNKNNVTLQTNTLICFPKVKCILSEGRNFVHLSTHAWLLNGNIVWSESQRAQLKLVMFWSCFFFLSVLCSWVSLFLVFLFLFF